MFGTLVLTPGFARNQWRVAEENWFAGFQRDTESAVVGRIVRSRHNGFFSDGALAGWGDAQIIEVWVTPNDSELQYRAFVEAAVARYKTKVDAFGTWNEPNLADSSRARATSGSTSSIGPPSRASARSARRARSPVPKSRRSAAFTPVISRLRSRPRSRRSCPRTSYAGTHDRDLPEESGLCRFCGGTVGRN